MVPSGHAPSPPAFVRLAAHPLRWKCSPRLPTAISASANWWSGSASRRTSSPTTCGCYVTGGWSLPGVAASTAATATTTSTWSAAPMRWPRPAPPCTERCQETMSLLRTTQANDHARRAAVLFVCTGNSVRSPMAEALLRHYAADSVRVTSAGTRPKRHLHPDMVRILGDRFGIDVAGQQPRDLSSLARRRFDHVITLCDKARETTPEFPHHPQRTHWSIPDPTTASGTEQGSLRRVRADCGRYRHPHPTPTSRAHFSPLRRFHP